MVALITAARRAWLLVALLGTTSATAVEPHLPATPDSTAGRLLQAQTLGADPATGWSWLRAWSQVFPNDPVAYRALRRGFVDLYLRQAIGEPFAADTSLASLREAGAALPPLEQDSEAQARWAGALQRGLGPLRAEVGAVPEEIGSTGNPPQALAPGLWLTRHPDGRLRNLAWAQRISVRGTVPLAPQALQARFTTPGGAALVFDCPPERGQPRVVRPGDTWLLLCRSRGELDERNPALRALVESLVRNGAASVAWASDDLKSQGALEGLIAALTARVPDRTARFAQVHLPCELRGRCAVEARAAQHERLRAGAPALEQPPRAAPTPRQLAQAVAALVAAFMVFCVVARTAGERVAAVLMLVLLLPLAWRFGLGFGAASVLLVGGAAGVALLATGAFWLAYSLYDGLVFNRVAPRPEGRPPHRRASS